MTDRPTANDPRAPAEIAADFDAIARGSGRPDAGGDDATWVASLVPRSAARVLDVGCGAGRLTRALAGPGRAVLGIDLSAEMIRLARAHAREVPDLSFEVADLMTWSPDGRSARSGGCDGFDAIVTVATLHHNPLEPALQRIVSWLSPGGRLVIVDLWRIAGVLDVVVSLAAAPFARLRRLRSASRARSARQLQSAWDRHAAGDRYLSMSEVRSRFPRMLPGCRVWRRWDWRYVVVWTANNASVPALSESGSCPSSHPAPAGASSSAPSA